jgi:hypothetical protein
MPKPSPLTASGLVPVPVGAGRCWRRVTSDSKSPASPVLKSKRWSTGSSTSTGAAAPLAHAGVRSPSSPAAGGRPSPALRPTSNAGTTHATYDEFGASRRGHTSRDRFCVLSAASRASRPAPVPGSTTWAWAQAHDSARSGSSTPGLAGGAIRSTGRWPLTSTVMPGWMRTTTSTIHGRNLPCASPVAGVNIHGTSGRSNSTSGK